MIIRPDNQHKPSPLRLSRGTKLSDIPNEAPPKLSEIESAFHIAEYLALLVRHDPHDIRSLVAIPEGMERRRKSHTSAHASEDEKNMWVYEHLRRLPVDLTVLVTSLLGTCTAETCPKMKADEWQYLCTAHGNEGAEECSAIDYILHTLDSTTALLTFHEVFPSRITILDGSVAHFPSLFRRLSRIFSHAYYSHRELFQLAEVETSLYARFVALCEKYELVGSKLLVIPRRVVEDTIDGKQELEQEQEDEDSEDDEIDDEEVEEEEEERGSRRREKDEEGGRRPHSLDRHARPHKLDDLRQKPDAGSAGTVKGKVEEPFSKPESEQPEQSAADTSSSSTESTPSTHPDSTSLTAAKTYSLKPKTKSDKSNNMTGTLGRSTLGKKSRGTMLWTSDTPTPTPAPASESVSTPIAERGPPLERTDSIETAIHTLGPEDLEGEGPVPPSQVDLVEEEKEEEEVEEVDVPKDEIELLEEEGVLSSGNAVAPLPSPLPATDDSTASGTGTGGDLPSSTTDEKSSTDTVPHLEEKEAKDDLKDAKSKDDNQPQSQSISEDKSKSEPKSEAVPDKEEQTSSSPTPDLTSTPVPKEKEPAPPTSFSTSIPEKIENKAKDIAKEKEKKGGKK